MSWLDRSVCVRLPDGREVVRYDAAGKYYIEYPDKSRYWLKLNEAASWALEPGAEVFLGRAGGRAFDRAVARLRRESGDSA